jgi:hypothetical protein
MAWPCEHIMSKINDTKITDRELTEAELRDDELDAISGGLTIQKQLDAASPKLGGGGGGSNAGPAIAAWNTLLGQYGAA